MVELQKSYHFVKQFLSQSAIHRGAALLVVVAVAEAMDGTMQINASRSPKDFRLHGCVQIPGVGVAAVAVALVVESVVADSAQAANRHSDAGTTANINRTFS